MDTMRRGRRLAHAVAGAALALITGLAAPAALALDLPTLDRISVMMSLDQVKYIAGPPDEMGRMAPYTLATWRMRDAPGMIAAGGLFDERQALIAQVYVFAGQTGGQALATMRTLGFKVSEGGDGVVRLFGSDDDTGRPLVVVIDEQPDMTTVYAYDQVEYDKRVAQGPLPTGPWTPVAVAPAAGAPAGGGMDPATRAAIINSIGIMAGQMKPIQKTTTLSSSSSTTRNPDGSITTRSSSTSVSVGADPAGVADALIRLMQ